MNISTLSKGGIKKKHKPKQTTKKKNTTQMGIGHKEFCKSEFNMLVFSGRQL